jgi:hypothetical protein
MTYVELKNIMLREMSQAQKDKFDSSHSYMESKWVELKGAESRMVVTSDWGKGVREWEMMVKGYKTSIRQE